MPRIICFALCLGLLQSPSLAQLGGLEELYGEGVHRYFSGDLMGADQILTQVVDSGSQDPRAYYFRGLAREQLGYGGEPDFEQGARLEAEGKRVVDVGNALSRIQGNVRTEIEVARRDARIQVEQQQLMLQRSRQPVPGAAVGQAPAIPASPLPSDSIPANDTGLAPLVPPAAPTPAAPSAPAVAVPPATAAEPADTSDPFADDAAPAAPAADAADPFGASATPSTPAAPAADAADPFGASATPSTPAAPAADAADPFGAPATPSTPAAPAADAADPFSAPEAGDSDDPFGS